MPVFVGCPACGFKVSVPETFLGRKIRCTACSKTFAATEEPPRPTNAPQPERAGQEPPPPAHGGPRRDWDDYDHGRRPARYDDFDDYDRPPVRRDQLPHRGGLILTLGILSIIFGALGLCTFGAGSVVALPTGLCAWVMGQGDLRQMDREIMDAEGRSNTHGGYICGIVGTMLCVVDVGCCLFSLSNNLVPLK